MQLLIAIDRRKKRMYLYQSLFKASLFSRKWANPLLHIICPYMTRFSDKCNPMYLTAWTTVWNFAVFPTEFIINQSIKLWYNQIQYSYHYRSSSTITIITEVVQYNLVSSGMILLCYFVISPHCIDTPVVLYVYIGISGHVLHLGLSKV